jgi:hypothetical protein
MTLGLLIAFAILAGVAAARAAGWFVWMRQRQQGHLPDYLLYLVAGLAIGEAPVDGGNAR